MSDPARARRRWLLPEVVQSSAMDCGPAALQCLLQGFGIHASYGRLREACQTSIDGSSIDSLEDVARQLGLEVDQIVIPADHVLLSAAQALPAIAVVVLPGGLTHFVVVWRSALGFVQVMDPGTGRRWPSAAAFEKELFIHELAVPAAAWREWAGTHEFLAPLQLRLTRLGLGKRCEPWLQEALADADWGGLARLDASTRMLTACVRSKCIRPGPEAASLMDTLLAAEQPEAVAIPAQFWSVRSAPEGDVPASLFMRGAVLLRATGQADNRQGSSADPAPPLATELDAALHEPQPQPVRQLLSMLQQDGWRWAAPIAAGLLTLAAGRMVELLLLRGLLEIAEAVTGAERRLLAMGGLLCFVVLLAALQFPISSVTMRIARRIEMQLRIALLEKLPRLGDRYFRSRSGSDMAERVHSLRHVRSHAVIAENLLYLGLQLALTAAGLIWISPPGALLVLLAVAATLAVPAAMQSFVAERHLRAHSHTGALLRFPLDALLGLIPIRCHAAERAVQSEHEDLLGEWARARHALLRAHVWAEGLQLAVTFAVVAWLLFEHLDRRDSAAGLLLFAYWALEIPAIGASIADIVRRYPVLRTVTLRALEPLGAAEENPRTAATAAPGSQERHAVRIEMQDVSVVAGGQPILEAVNLKVAPAEHVAIVGASGAGKSTLLGLLLGWHRPASGRLQVDGLAHASEWIEAVRGSTVWIDPQVQLWNRSLLDNVRYGSVDEIEAQHLFGRTGLYPLIGALPLGSCTSLGENGRCLAGGEAQRVRLARGLARRAARLVILDEPFRGLDRSERATLLAGVREDFAHATVLCASHDLEHTLTFGRVLVMRAGRIVEDGDPKTLLRDRSSQYRALLAAEHRLGRAPWSRFGLRRVGLEELRCTEGGREGAS